MSVSSLPEWKQLLLERKRREEEEKERREREEEARLASMPAWKRGIIQRRRAKQEGGAGGGEREREQGREACMVGGKPPQVTTTMESLVSVETICPVRQNPFIRCQAWKKGGQEVGRATGEGAGPERAKVGRGQGGEAGLEREGGEAREMRGMPEKERWEDRKRDRGNGREANAPRGRREEWAEPEGGRSPAYFPRPLVPSLRTIRAKNIIIIEKDRGGGKERGEEREEGGQEEEDGEDEGEKEGMRMGLREILAGGGSVTEIKATEVLIIKPAPAPDTWIACRERERERERERGGEGEKEAGEREREAPIWREKERREKKEWRRAREVEVGIQSERDTERERGRERDRERERERQSEGSVLRERGRTETGVGLVSKLRTKFGEQPKPPSRSKSSDCFVPPRRREGRGPGADTEGVVACRGVPKRSFSFSERVISAGESGAGPEQHGCHGDGPGRRGGGDCPSDEREGAEYTDEGEGPERATGVEPKKELTGFCGREVEGEDTGSGEIGGGTEEGFTVASLKSVEGVGFARRLVVRQEGREGMLGNASWRTGGEQEVAPGRRGDRGEDKRQTRPDTTDSTPIAPTERLTQSGEPQRPGGPPAPAGGTEESEGLSEADPGRTEPGEASRCAPSLGSQVQIPREHFYREEAKPGAEAGSLLLTEGGGGGGGGKEGWIAGRPLTHVESPREKIRQRQREREVEKEPEGGELEESGTGEVGAVQRQRERRLQAAEEEGEVEEGRKAEEEEERGGPLPFQRVTQEQEVAAPKPGPRLPASVVRAVIASTAEAAERSSVSPPSPGVQGPAGGQVQGPAADRSPQESAQERGGEREGDGGERESQPCCLPASPSPSPTRSLSPPSPVHMSRVYSFTAAGCRGTDSFGGRRAEPVGQGAEPEEEATGPGDVGAEPQAGSLAKVQKQVELLRLREQKSAKPLLQPARKVKGEAPAASRVQRTSQPAPRSQPQPPRSFTVTPQAGPPSAKSPEQTPPAAPSHPIFSLKSSGGVQGKRGNTITITPRKTPAGPGAARAEPAPAPNPTPNGTSTAPGDRARKRYPTTEEIEVIGGYESLDRSCLVKQGWKNKGVKVCFDETQLERVCEYPSESSMMASFPCPAQPNLQQKNQAREDEDKEEEEEEEGVAFTSGSIRITGSDAGRRLRVDESCRR